MRYEFQVHTFGCKVNTYDTGLLQKRLGQAGQTPLSVAPSGAASASVASAGVTTVPRVHILNTCAVTAEASKDAARLVRRLKSREPFSTIVVTGCGAQVDGAVFDDLPGADLVIANSHKGQLERLLDQHFNGTLTERVFRSNIFRKDDLEIGGGEEATHTRAFLKIQDGCNSFCTYCVIPFARGKSRSIPAREIIAKINELVAHGTREVVLTGVHIGDYEDKALTLAGLVQTCLRESKISRLRLSSLEPVELTDDLLAAYQDERLCAHFHMSIQSANTRILKLMRRHYEAEQVEQALTRIASDVPGAFVGMDVIAGFPGETEEDFQDTYSRLASLPWTRLHVFPYSERPGTKAAVFEDRLPQEVKVRRASRLRELSAARFQAAALAQVGLIKRALVLKATRADGAIETLARDYWPVRVPLLEVGHEMLVGGEIDIEVTGFVPADGGRMDGVLVGRLAVNEERAHG